MFGSVPALGAHSARRGREARFCRHDHHLVLWDRERRELHFCQEGHLFLDDLAYQRVQLHQGGLKGVQKLHWWWHV
jgi:hypothetical protein